MNNFDHDDETTEKPEITFNLETAVADSLGEPVFSEDLESDEGEILAEESSELENADSVELEAEACDASESDDEETVEESVEESGEGEDGSEEGRVTTLNEELTLAGKIEAIIFASPKPMRAVEIHDLLTEQGYTLKEVQDVCDELIEFYRDHAGGFHLKYIKRMGYQFQTTTAAKTLMEKQFASRPRPLSRAALETLAVIAYRQKQSKGVTRAEVEFIRGVDAGSIFKTLVERNLLTCIGRKEIPGRPMMFGVTDEFLKIFQLGSISDLPALESFQTPQDVLDAAEQKISDFEAEQAGVDTEQFIADEDYSDAVRGAEDFNPLAADAPAYAPVIERPDMLETPALTEEISAQEDSSQEQTEELTGEPEGESSADLIDVLNEGQVAWSTSDVHTENRPIQGATAGGVISSLDAIDESEWGDLKPVEMTANESKEGSLEASEDESSEALLDERDETTEVAVPTGDSQPPRGGEVDQ